MRIAFLALLLITSLPPKLVHADVSESFLSSDSAFQASLSEIAQDSSLFSVPNGSRVFSTLLFRARQSYFINDYIKAIDALITAQRLVKSASSDNILLNEVIQIIGNVANASPPLIGYEAKAQFFSFDGVTLTVFELKKDFEGYFWDEMNFENISTSDFEFNMPDCHIQETGFYVYSRYSLDVNHQVNARTFAAEKSYSSLPEVLFEKLKNSVLSSDGWEKYVVNTSGGTLNVRNQPSNLSTAVVAVLNNGDNILAREMHSIDRWLEVAIINESETITGYAASNYLSRFEDYTPSRPCVEIVSTQLRPIFAVVTRSGQLIHNGYSQEDSEKFIESILERLE